MQRVTPNLNKRIRLLKAEVNRIKSLQANKIVVDKETLTECQRQLDIARALCKKELIATPIERLL